MFNFGIKHLIKEILIELRAIRFGLEYQTQQDLLAQSKAATALRDANGEAEGVYYQGHGMRIPRRAYGRNDVLEFDPEKYVEDEVKFSLGDDTEEMKRQMDNEGKKPFTNPFP